jgi:sodium pump decarboxylase gamma subunit
MDILNSLYTSVFGMGVVFVALVFLILLINLQTFLTGKLAARQIVPPPAAMPDRPAAILPPPARPTKAVPQQDLKLTGVDDKTAAIIMAIVCAETKSSPNELYFKSIRLLDDQAPVKKEGV